MSPSKIALKNTCYWCGKESTSDDHIPPKSYFPLGKNINLKKIPSCAEHNEMFSKLDDRFKFYIQAAADSIDAFNQFKDKTIRGLQKPQAAGYVKSLASSAHPITTKDGKTLAFEVSPETQSLYFEKLIRGAYFLAFGESVQGHIVSTSPQFVTPGLDYKTISKNLAPYINDPNLTHEFKAENPDIFRFKYAKIYDPDGNAVSFILITFYNSVEILGLITPIRPA